jgi:hypothetical protein
MRRMSSPATSEPRKQLLKLVGAVVVLHAVFIGAYYALDISGRAQKTQQAYVAVWVLLTLAIVTPLMKRIRQARRRR